MEVSKIQVEGIRSSAMKSWFLSRFGVLSFSLSCYLYSFVPGRIIVQFRVSSHIRSGRSYYISAPINS